jgi:glucose-6-phosphate isomerase
MTTLTRSPAWQALASHYGQIKHLHLRGLFADDPGRAARLSAEGAGLFLDYSKNRITDETLQLLLALGEERGVAWRSGAMRCSPVTRSTSQSAVRFCT